MSVPNRPRRAADWRPRARRSRLRSADCEPVWGGSLRIVVEISVPNVSSPVTAVTWPIRACTQVAIEGELNEINSIILRRLPSREFADNVFIRKLFGVKSGGACVFIRRRLRARTYVNCAHFPPINALRRSGILRVYTTFTRTLRVARKITFILRNVYSKSNEFCSFISHFYIVNMYVFLSFAQPRRYFPFYLSGAGVPSPSFEKSERFVIFVFFS